MLLVVVTCLSFMALWWYILHVDLKVNKHFCVVWRLFRGEMPSVWCSAHYNLFLMLKGVYNFSVISVYI